jgi:hypothetical protein
MEDAWSLVKNYCLTLWCENTVVSTVIPGHLRSLLSDRISIYQAPPVPGLMLSDKGLCG